MAVQMQTDIPSQGLSSFGLTRSFEDDSILEEGEHDDRETEESDELEEVDASDDVDEEEEPEEEEEEEDKFETRAKKAEELTRKFQSEADTQRSERDKMAKELDTLKSDLAEIKQSVKAKDDFDLESVEDDDLVYGKHLRQILEDKAPSKEAEEVERKTKEYMDNIASQENQRRSFVNSQSDFKDVRDYVSKNKAALENDALISSVTTDSLGTYAIVRMRMIEEKLKRVSRSGKKRVPPMGGGSSGSRNKDTSQMTRLERQFEGTFGDRGLAD